MLGHEKSDKTPGDLGQILGHQEIETDFCLSKRFKSYRKIGDTLATFPLLKKYDDNLYKLSEWVLVYF